MSGMARHTGKVIGDEAHLAQSIADILTTPVGTRVMRRDYGSRLPELVDAPMNGETLIDVFAATADALDRWEPRLVLTRVEVTTAAAGQLEMRLEGRTQFGDVSFETAVGTAA